MVKLIIGLSLCLYFTGCTLKVGMDWNGQTAKDDRTYTQNKGDN